MNHPFQLVHFEHLSGKASDEGAAPSATARFSPENTRAALEFHRSFPEYEPTPLVSLPCLSDRLGVREILVKDESFRFHLNAFKVLGGSYAIGRYIAQILGKDISALPYSALVSDEIRKELGEITFVTATDGNHGRGVAWTASRLHQKCVVYLPEGSSEERLNNIRLLGAEAEITNLNYDDAVRLARRNAEKNGWTVVQDTSWDGYEQIPGWIMEGYTTMAAEVLSQLGPRKPTHIFLQAGVGAMAGAVAGFFTEAYGPEDRPVIIIVEPDQADCIFRTARANDGTLHRVSGRMDTIMAGLSCGEPCPLGWASLRSCADFFLSVPDYAAMTGMRLLGRNTGSDLSVISGESGAAGLGAAAEILSDPALSGIREEIGLSSDSSLLFFSTEGDTDRASYRRIVGDI